MRLLGQPPGRFRQAVPLWHHTVYSQLQQNHNNCQNPTTNGHEFHNSNLIEIDSIQGCNNKDGKFKDK